MDTSAPPVAMKHPFFHSFDLSLTFMQKLAQVFFSAFLLSLMFAPAAQAQDWSESRLQNMYLDYLKDQGMEGWVDSDGDVQFKYNDHSYFIEVNEDDNEFFRVVLFNIWPIESASEREQVEDACDAVNRSLKCTKAYTTNDNVWMAVELFVGKPDYFMPVFMRSLNVIEQGVDRFVEEM